jgi:transposase
MDGPTAAELTMDLRQAKALEIAARVRLTMADGFWVVPSQSGAGITYKVVTWPGAESCTCDDFATTSRHCKHIIACQLVEERDGKRPAPPIDTNTIPKKASGPQVWPLYNLAQQTEKDRFQELLSDLLQGVEEPPQAATGRKRTTLRDMIFASALKVFTGFSSRRFACDLRDAHKRKRLSKLMNSMSVSHYLENEALTPALVQLIERSALPLRGVEQTFAPDSTGFSTSRFVRWYDEKYGCERSGRSFVKAHAMTGTKTNIVTAVIIEGQNAHDSPMFKPLVETTVANGFTIKDVPADKAYLSRDNLELVAGLGGTAYIPFKVNSVPGEAGTLWDRMFGYFQFRRDDFLKHYHQRSNVESTFSMVKAKFRDHVRSKTETAMKNEVLCKFLCHNIVVVHQAVIELGIEPVFWGEPQPDGPRDVLPMLRRG